MFVSVERVLDPRLACLPVIVLSNNDGCAVSRSDEAKALGVSMGQPWFEIRRKPIFDDVIGLSSNYEEYGAFSARFHETVATLSAVTEIYSVDEAFVELPRIDATAKASEIQARVAQWLGLPTAAGIGPTKTLAKVAQRHAKDLGQTLVDLSGWPRRDVDELLDATPVGEVWGIGSRLTKGLSSLGVMTAGDLARADAGVLRRRWSVVLERTARELSGVPCMPVGFTPRDRQQLMFSRMLGSPVATRDEMRSVLTTYASSACRRLRAHGLEAAMIQTWISSSRFRDRVEHHSSAAGFAAPTDDALELIRAAHQVLPQMIEGHPYNRAGVLLSGLSPAGSRPALWSTSDPARANLSSTLDTIQERYGSRAVGFGSTGLRERPAWSMRRGHLSPAATTDWSQLLTVR